MFLDRFFLSYRAKNPDTNTDTQRDSAEYSTVAFCKKATIARCPERTPRQRHHFRHKWVSCGPLLLHSKIEKFTKNQKTTTIT